MACMILFFFDQLIRLASASLTDMTCQFFVRAQECFSDPNKVMVSVSFSRGHGVAISRARTGLFGGANKVIVSVNFSCGHG